MEIFKTDRDTYSDGCMTQLIPGSSGAFLFIKTKHEQQSKIHDLSRFGTTVYGYSQSVIDMNHSSCTINSAMAFSIPMRFEQDFTIYNGTGMFIVQPGFVGQRCTTVVEKQGRLSYIDGCSDSVLIYPPRKGNPTMNSLHFPANITQTEHTHPSVRVGLVVSGRGFAYYTNDSGKNQEMFLIEGDIFVLPPHEKHYFQTRNHEMNLVVWHPDSDHGPEDHDHPMLNRTHISK